jgi:hypothetical protein
VRVGAAPTKSSRFGTTGRAGLGERDEKVYARNRCSKASSCRASSKPVDRGWNAVRTHSNALRVGNFQAEVDHLVWETTVKVYGVAVVIPQGQSRVPHSSTG